MEGTVTLENFPYLNYEYELLLKLFMKELKYHYCNTTKQQYVSEFNSNISRSFGYAFGKKRDLSLSSAEFFLEDETSLVLEVLLT